MISVQKTHNKAINSDRKKLRCASLFASGYGWRSVSEKRKMHLYIVGTHHKHQFACCNAFDPAEQESNAFAVYLKEQCQSLNIQTLAEEMCSDARQKWQIQQTVPQSVADELGISHTDCDPTEKERAVLGIQNEGLIKMNGLMHEEPEETVQENIRAEYDKREWEWIRRLDQLQHERVLFVCGTDHSRSFAEKTVQRGWNTVTEEWTPNQ